MPYEILTLTPDQMAYVQANYATTDVGTIARHLFGETNAEGKRITANSTEGRSIKAALVGMGVTPRVAEDATGDYVLTPEQIQLINDIAPKVRKGGTLEIARLAFDDPDLKVQSAKWRAVWKYLKEVYPDKVNTSEDPVDELEYKPPASLNVLVGIVNDYVTTGDVTKRVYLWGKLKISEERQLRALMSYLRIFGFKVAASQYEKQVDRELYLSTFMRWTHDKPDLTQIEIDQFISAAQEKVNIAQLDRLIIQIDSMHQEIITSGGEIDENGKKRKFGMTDVELINQIRSKHGDAKKRLADLMKTLETSRSQRIAELGQRNATIVNLFDAWMKDETKRQNILDMGDREKEEDAREVGKLRDWDDVSVMIAGQTESEAAN